MHRRRSVRQADLRPVCTDSNSLTLPGLGIRSAPLLIVAQTIVLWAGANDLGDDSINRAEVVEHCRLPPRMNGEAAPLEEFRLARDRE